MTVYGIPNCDTMQKALTWLKQNNLAYDFHDYKKLGITEAKLKEWTKQVDWQVLLNKKGTTWRKLDADAQSAITTEKTAIAFMQQNTSAIKRPVIETAKGILIGFDEAAYSKQLL